MSKLKVDDVQVELPQECQPAPRLRAGGMKCLWLSMLACVTAPAMAAAQDTAVLQMRAQAQAGHEPEEDPVRIHAIAMCAARRLGGVETLATWPNSSSEARYIVGMRPDGDPTCQPLSHPMLVGGRFLRGAAAEYLLENPAAPQSRRTFAMPGNEQLMRLDPNTRNPLLFIQIGECTARTNLSGVMALLATEVGSAEERAAFTAVRPSVAGCVPAEVTFQVSRLLIRGYLAEGAYRNALAARAGRN
jgi:hypothetical protein